MNKTHIKTISKKWQLAFDWLPLLILPFINPYKKILPSRKLKPVKKKTVKLSKPTLYFKKLLDFRPTSSTAILLVGVGGIIYFSFIGTNEPDLQPVSQYPISIPTVNYDQKSEKKGLDRSVPVKLTIDSIGLEVPLMEVGKQADGTMEVPPLFKNIAGWYKYSPTPGEIGPSVIAGHVDTYKGPSVFWKLRELKPGQIVSIKRQDGKTVKFKIDGLEQFDQSNFPTKKVYGNIDKAGLRLITCGGTFNKKTLQYSENTVVFASYVE